MKIRVACAQIAPFKAELDRNLDLIAEAIVTAHGEQVDLVAFAETATTAYFLEGGVLEEAISADDLAARLQSRLVGKISRPIDAVIGFYEMSEGQVYNSAAYIEFSASGARTTFVYRKFFLATYGVFDEDRFVARGREFGVHETRFGKIGILICEDVWHSVMPTLQALGGAKLIIVPSASPARGFSGEKIGNLDRYQRMLRSFAEEHGVFAMNVQLVGFEGGKGFVGGSSVVDPFGETIAVGPVQEEHLLVADLDLDLIQIARHNLPLLADLRSHLEDLKRHLEQID